MRVLVTRPETQGAELCKQIERMGGFALHYPLIDISFPTIQAADSAHFCQSDIVIAVSQYAVQGLEHYLNRSSVCAPKQAIYLGVGQKTAHELSKLVQQNVNYPSISDSEHLLALPELAQISGQVVTILRGNGGRELIYEQLTKRGAYVQYLEMYQRQYRSFDKQALEHWQDSKIDTLVVTSGEQLEYLLSQVPESSHDWLRQHQLLVPSERIANLAMTQGFNNVTNTQGASNSTLFAALQRLKTGLNNDEQK
ncbi:uroporphyrinogen-III synthase [Vibrio maritimus]|uniref:uroporphyrinogen-III synthase n=1 Tax=Vibrio maritimus TaxID=990268 RepID=UPI00406759F7